MKKIIYLFTLTLLLPLGACTNVLNSVNKYPYTDHPGKRSSGVIVDDQLLETKAEVNLKKASPALSAANIDVKCFNGIVLLTGQTDSYKNKQLAEQVVKRFRHTRKVHNYIDVAGKSSVMSRSNDSWLSTKINSRLLADKRIQSRRIDVHVENGTAYLMGLLTRKEGRTASDIARTTVGIQRVVILFEYIN